MMSTTAACHLCGRKAVAELLDFGMQPICNRYLADPSGAEIRHPLAVGRCESCGLVQILRPFPAGDLKPVYDWISTLEPEDHLDRLAEILTGLPGIGRSSLFCGMTFKDDSLLARLRGLGFEQVWRIDPKRDLGIEDSWGGVETVQDRFGPEAAARIARQRGRPDVIVARHILEHAHRLDRFIKGLKELVRPGGTIVLESPDCSRAFEAGDCTVVWEEHVLYFTPETFQRSLSFSGFSLVRFDRFPYPLEDSLVGIVQLDGQASPGLPSAEPLPFARNFLGRRDQFKRLLSKVRQDRGRVALLGAGHLACAFINLMDLKEEIDFVVDNDPRKKGLFMPGSRLPICDSEALLERKVKLCLLGVNPGSQSKVIQKHRTFLEAGGAFLSIFPSGGKSPAPVSSFDSAEVACP